MNGPKIRRLYYSASEIAETVHVPPHVLKQWESVFPNLKSVNRGGRRLFSPDDFQRILEIKRLVDQGVPLDQVNSMLNQPPRPASGGRLPAPFDRPSGVEPPKAPAMISELLHELKEILHLLQSVLA